MNSTMAMMIENNYGIYLSQKLALGPIYKA